MSLLSLAALRWDRYEIAAAPSSRCNQRSWLLPEPYTSFPMSTSRPFAALKSGIRRSDIEANVPHKEETAYKRKGSAPVSKKTNFRVHQAYINFENRVTTVTCVTTGISNLHIPLAQAGINSVPGHHISKTLAASRLALPVRSQSAIFRRDSVRFLATMMVKDLNSNSLSLSPLSVRFGLRRS